MSKLINVTDGSTDIYNIRISNGFQELNEHLKPFLKLGKKVAIFSDSNVEPIYGDELKNIVTGLGNTCINFTFPAGEESKTLDTVQDAYEFLIKNNFERRDVLIALGGGVVGDLIGFVAATYLRGISFIQIPTTLLSQTDSSVGGKTGVDFRGFKNMVGAFYQPLLCYMNMDSLKTLEKRQYLSGLAEVIKAALIKDAEFFRWIIDNSEDILDLKGDIIEEMIYKACLIKKRVVERDVKEAGERALLNFGHTLGHAIEKWTNFNLFHGECVVIGMIAAMAISRDRGLISHDDFDKTYNFFKSIGYKLTIPFLDIDEIILFSQSDKKMEAGVLKFVLLDGIGNAKIYKDVTEEELRKSLSLVSE